MQQELTGESAETRACTFAVDPRGFIRATIKDGVEMDVGDSREALETTARLGRGRPARVLVDSRGVRYQTKEAREDFVSEEAEKVCSRVALLVGSPVSRMIGNFFLRNSAHRAPTRLFTDEAAAIEWLLRDSP